MIFYHVVNLLNLAFLECFHADLHPTLREGCKERKNVKSFEEGDKRRHFFTSSQDPRRRQTVRGKLNTFETKQ